MATTVSSDALVSSIQSEIQRVQDDLIGVEENLKRLTGRDFNEPRGERRTRQISTGEREDEPPSKRRPPGGVFARLGDPVVERDAPPSRGRRVHEVLEEGELPRPKPAVASSVARPVNDGKSRTEAAAELTRDRASRDRNRRMFGALLGTLQRFRTEEAKQKGKDEQRAKIERKLEEKGRAEKEELRKERLELINQRKERQLRIERLNFKIERVKEHEAWEAGQRRLGKFIRTQRKPRIFWLPKVNNSRTSALISQTKHAIERELEEARLRLKDELDEVLGGGGRINYSFKSSVRERESEVDNDDFNNGSDLLDYDAEEGELVYDDLLLSGKQKQKGMGSERRVVVQVDSDVSRAPQRRVELVTVVAERGRRVKEVDENESEKENVIKSKINVEHKKVIENGGDKGRVKEKEKKKEKEKDKSRGKEKRVDKKVSPEKHQKSHSSRESSKKEAKSSRKEKKKEETVKVREVEIEILTENQTKNDSETDNDRVASDANVTNEEENSTHGTEDLSQISLPLDPEPESTPKITEVVVQHVPLNSNDDSQNSNEEEMQVETVLLDTSQIKQDKTEWDDFPPLPIVIKKEKDATPEKSVEENKETPKKTRDENNQRKKEDSSSDSSDSDSDSSAESDDDDDSSSEDSSSESSSSSNEDRKKKRKDKDKDKDKNKDKDKEKDKGKSKRKDQSSSSESSESDDSESDSDSSSDDEKKQRKKLLEKRKLSPKYSRKNEKEKESDKKKVERKKDTRKSSRSRSRSRDRRSRSRDRKRARSRSRDRRRDRR